MAFQQVPDTCEIVPRFSFGGRILTMTFYARFIGGYEASDLQDLAEEVDAFWIETIDLIATPAQRYENVSVRGLDLENDIEVVEDTGGAAGTLAVSANAPQVAFCLKRLSGLTGRSARGRVYFPFIPSSHFQTDRAYVTEAFAEGLRTVMIAQRNLINVGSRQEVIVSRYTGGDKRVIAFTFPVTTWTYTDLRVDTQRRRLPQEV